MHTQRTGPLWRRLSGGLRSSPRSPDLAAERRIEMLDARLESLEKALEGLQDALYRHEVLQDKTTGELRRRTEPERIARDLSEDARRRGL